MRTELPAKIEAGRISNGPFGSDKSYGACGAFHVVGPTGTPLVIMSTNGFDTGWEHVSVSKTRHPPNWLEMCWVKDQFWNDDECVVQYHPPKAHYVNNSSNCLHLWRKRDTAFPQPSEILVGVKSLGTLR